MVFITDIRRGNLHTQLMYKALVELSADRAEFVSRLFSKPRPPGLTASTSASDSCSAFWTVETGPQAVFEANFTAVVDHLTKTPHTLSLSQTTSRASSTSTTRSTGSVRPSPTTRRTVAGVAAA